jgi:hypothetical protein
MAKDTSKGRITEMVYSRTRQVADYEPERLEIKSTVGESEDPEDVYLYLKQTAEYLLFEAHDNKAE